LEFLESQSKVSKELVRDVRRIARDEGHSNLGLSAD